MKINIAKIQPHPTFKYLSHMAPRLVYQIIAKPETWAASHLTPLRHTKSCLTSPFNTFHWFHFFIQAISIEI